jgi:3-oxoacyl-[acyl-carrier protein] reductase
MISAPLVAFCDNGFGGAAWAYTQPAFAGTPGKANCCGKSVSALAGQYGGLNAAAAALGFPSAVARPGQSPEEQRRHYGEEPMADWTDQVAIITGSSRGIGRAIARALPTRGAAICINHSSRAAEAEAAAAEIAAAGGRVIAIQADVADADALARMVVRTEAELGPVSILVNNAGVSSPMLESYDPAAMARMRRVNVDGVIHTIRAVAPGMQERGYGRIVNIASNAAIGTALPGTTFYAATKAEVLILTRRFAMELGHRGVTVNAVAPGWIVTEMARTGRSEEEFEVRVRSHERAHHGRADGAAG